MHPTRPLQLEVAGSLPGAHNNLHPEIRIQKVLLAEYSVKKASPKPHDTGRIFYYFCLVLTNVSNMSSEASSNHREIIYKKCLIATL